MAHFDVERGDIRFRVKVPHGSSDFTCRLAEGVLRRNITAARVRLLIQLGADPNATVQLTDLNEGWELEFSLIELCIDGWAREMASSAYLYGIRWEGPADGGASVVREMIAGGGLIAGSVGETALYRAVCNVNRSVVDLLIGIGVRLSGNEAEEEGISESLLEDMLEYHRDLHFANHRPASGQDVLYMIRTLTRRWPHLLAHERTRIDCLRAVLNHPVLEADAQEAILTHLHTNPRPLPIDDREFGRLLARAARGMHHTSIDWLHSTDPAAFRASINTRVLGATPLSQAAGERMRDDLPDDLAQEWEAERGRCIRRMIQLGACVEAAGVAPLKAKPTEQRQQWERRALQAYSAELSQLSTGEAVMAAVNAALRPMRTWAANLSAALPDMTTEQLTAAFPHQSSPSPMSPSPSLPPPSGTRPLNRDVSAFTWRIGSFFVDPSALEGAIETQTTLGKRINAAMRRYVVEASSLSVSCNQEITGTSKADHKRTRDGQQLVRPSLQCFALGGVRGARLGLREVVRCAIAEEAAKYGLAVDGMSCVPLFDWRQLGYVAGGGAVFVLMGME